LLSGETSRTGDSMVETIAGPTISSGGRLLDL
jgi:hypothetical protein